MEPRLAITSVHFHNFKALRDFSLALSSFNILVGPNNSGKSTIVSAFRALAASMQRARIRNPAMVRAPGGLTRRGWAISSDVVPMLSLENVHTEYEDVESTVEFRLSNDSRLTL